MEAQAQACLGYGKNKIEGGCPVLCRLLPMSAPSPLSTVTEQQSAELSRTYTHLTRVTADTHANLYHISYSSVSFMHTLSVDHILLFLPLFPSSAPTLDRFASAFISNIPM